MRNSLNAMRSHRLVSSTTPTSGAPATAAVTYEGQPAERTFVAFKPDTLQRSLLGKQLSRFEQRGLQLCALKMLVPTRSLAEAHYAEHRGKSFFERVCIFLSSGPVVASVWEGRGAIGACRAMIGVTEPLESAPGTIRGDYGVHWRRNLVHGSDSPEAAAREVGLWFEPHEVMSWAPADRGWRYELPDSRIAWEEARGPGSAE